MSATIRYLATANRDDLIREMAAIGVSTAGIAHMSRKGNCLCFRVDGLSNPGVLIIKQKLLSLGGEAAVSRNALVGGSAEKGENGLIIMATPLQLEQLLEYLSLQNFGLPQLASQLGEAMTALDDNPPPIAYHNQYGSGSLSFETPLVMGIVNMTPDSFFDGGKYNTVAQGIAQVKALVAAGADLIDIGGASSRPGFNPVAADTELMRVLPLISELVPWLEVPISIDTDKIEVAAAAVAAGVAVLNYTGVLNQNILRLAKDSHAPVVLMHQGGGADVLESVGGFFREALAMAAQVGLEREQIILDPGIGFDKNPQENIRILAHLSEFLVFGRPLLLGMSNKRFLGAITEMPVDQRNLAGAVAAALGYQAGAAIFRVHDVGATRQALAVAAAMKRGNLDG